MADLQTLLRETKNRKPRSRPAFDKLVDAEWAVPIGRSLLTDIDTKVDLILRAVKAEPDYSKSEAKE